MEKKQEKEKDEEKGVELMILFDLRKLERGEKIIPKAGRINEIIKIKMQNKTKQKTNR